MASEDRSRYDIPYRIFMTAVAVIMLGSGIAYGYANYKGDECIRSTHTRLDAIKARIDAMKKTN
jgi:hypothetical protein